MEWTPAAAYWPLSVTPEAAGDEKTAIATLKSIKIHCKFFQQQGFGAVLPICDKVQYKDIELSRLIKDI